MAYDKSEDMSRGNMHEPPTCQYGVTWYAAATNSIVQSYSAKNDFYREMAVNKLDFSLMCWYWSIQTPKKKLKKFVGGKVFYGPRPFPIAGDLLEIWQILY